MHTNSQSDESQSHKRFKLYGIEEYCVLIHKLLFCHSINRENLVKSLHSLNISVYWQKPRNSNDTCLYCILINNRPSSINDVCIFLFCHVAGIAPVCCLQTEDSDIEHNKSKYGHEFQWGSKPKTFCWLAHQKQSCTLKGMKWVCRYWNRGVQIKDQQKRFRAQENV